MRPRWLRLGVAFVVALLVLAACAPQGGGGASPSGSATGQARKGGTFTYAQSGDACSLDPWNVTDGNSLLVDEQIFEPLVTYAPTSFEIQPNLATKWEKNADGTQWTFTLRDGVKFTDGTDFDAAAVVFNFERGRFTKNQYRGAKPLCDEYEYYSDMFGGYDDKSIITKVEAVDKTHVRFTTSSPLGPFLANTGMGTFGMVSPKSIKDDPDGWSLPNSKGASGTGAFMFQPGAWQKDQQITLTRNPNYWKKDDKNVQLPYLDKLVIRFIKDTQARLAELKAGTIDAMQDFSPADIPSITSDPNLQLIPRPAFNVGYLGVNTHKAPLDKLAVRQAIAEAIDKASIAKAIYAGQAKPATQFLVPGMLGYDQSVNDFYKYDPNDAKAKLQSAGVASGTEIDLWYMPVSRPYYPDPKKIAEAFAADLGKVGINAKLNTIDWATYRKNARDNQFSLWLLGWTGDNGDPDNFVCVFFCDPKTNGQWDDATAKQAQQIMLDAQKETDSSKRAQMYMQVSKLVQSDVPRIPMFNADPPTAATKKVSGFVPHPRGSQEFSLVQVSK